MAEYHVTDKSTALADIERYIVCLKFPLARIDQ